MDYINPKNTAHAVELVAKKQPFGQVGRDSRRVSIYARWYWDSMPHMQSEPYTHHPNLYVVYSYGPHWPMFIYDTETDQWFENGDKYSVTTSKHTNKIRPCSYRDTVLMSCDDMVSIVSRGSYTEFVTYRLTHSRQGVAA